MANNEIEMFVPLVDPIDISGKTITADAKKLLAYNRKHWGIESVHYILDWN